MNRFQRALGKVCDNCPLCNYARKNPDTHLGKFMSWHGKHCPAWKAQKQLEEERRMSKQKDKGGREKREH